MKNKEAYICEAEKIGTYILGISILDAEKENYADAMKKANIVFTNYEKLLWENMLQSKRKMTIIDSYLSATEPNNAVRRKLFIMLAILEASPNYTSYFLSKNFSFFYFFKIGLIGCRALLKRWEGKFIVNRIKRKCQ